MNPAASAKTRAWNLRALLAECAMTAPEGMPGDIVVTDMTLDSREVRPGGMFVALPGGRTHGIGFAAQAAQAGARAILWEPSAAVAPPQLPEGTAPIAMPGLSAVLGDLADRFFDSPSQALQVVGVTGTNGKTTTAYVLASALAQLGMSAAYAGTLGVGRVGRATHDTLRQTSHMTSHTTPDCITVHRQMAELRDAGAHVLGMEVSSHALDQHRVDGVRFDTAVFTNLTRDHLDYHGSLDAYGAAKARLFSWPGLKHAVINGDDAFGRALPRGSDVEVVLYGRHSMSDAIEAGRNEAVRGAAGAEKIRAAGAAKTRSLHARRIAATPTGLDIEIDGSWGVHALQSRLIGDFNAENLLAVLGCLLGWDVPLSQAVAALARCEAPPGRMETLTAAGRALVIIDYAHTPDALEKSLWAARGHCAGRLVCVFGCGGERDRGKRPLMASVAEHLADAVVITDDNPRGEDGDAIVADIMQGFADPGRVVIERDRAAAIAGAIHDGRTGDVVLIAGKGHEDYQIIGTQRRRFSDRQAAIAALGSGAAP